MNVINHLRVIVLLSVFLIGSCAFTYSLIGRPLNYYYELNYEKDNKPRLVKSKTANKWFFNVNNKTTNKPLFNYKRKKRFLSNTSNNAPKTFEEYLTLSKELKRVDFSIPQPTLPKDDKIVPLPDPNLRVVKYNNPPGIADINLNDLLKDNKSNSAGVLSPDNSKLVYSVVNYCPAESSVTSEMFSIDIKGTGSIKDKLANSNVIQRNRVPILTSENPELIKNQFKTLVLLDWSSDSKKIAVKEKVGSIRDGIWQTSLIVYDFDKQQSYKLNAVREAIKYWWKNNKNIDLIDYMWDIYPIGWDANDPDRIVVYAYAYGSNSPKFLGTWSIDYKGTRSEFLSLDKTDFPISTNGLTLKMVVRE